MKSKTLSFVLCFALLALTLSFASALTITNTDSTSFDLNQDSTSQLVTITLNDSGDVSFVKSGNVNVLNTTATNNVTSATFTISALVIPASSGASSTAQVNFTAINPTNSTDKATRNYIITLKNTTTPFGPDTNTGYLIVDGDEFNLVEGFGDDNENPPFFYPLDEVEYTFNVEAGDWDIQNIEITAWLVDESSGKTILKESKMDISEDDFDLDSGDDTDVTLSFTIDPNKLESGNNNYKLYVRAKGEIKDNDAPDALDGNTTSDSISEDLGIITNDDFVIMNNFVVAEGISCDSEFEITAEVWNVGDSDLNNDEVNILIYNKELGINQKVQLSEDLNALDSQEVTFTLKMPANIILNKAYNIEFSVYSDDSYSDRDLYENKNDDKSEFNELVSSTLCNTQKPVITADLSSETPNAFVGKQVIVESTIKNTGVSANTYTVEVTGNSQWSSVASIDPKTITLNAGESKKVLIYIDVNADAEVGAKEFTIKTTATNGIITEQKVALTVEKGFSSSALINHLKNNWYIYAIVLVNLILIIAIIIVIVRLVRKSSD